MSGSVRIERLQQLIKERVAEAALFEIKDPRMGFLTITKVKLARDLTVATVFYSVLGHEGERKRTHEALEASRGHFQREVGKVMQTRLTPKLEFRYDQSIEGMIRVHKILDDVTADAKKREAAAAPKPADPDAGIDAPDEDDDIEDEDEDDDDDDEDDDEDDEDDADEDAGDEDDDIDDDDLDDEDSDADVEDAADEDESDRS